jgi:hypothetical protein
MFQLGLGFFHKFAGKDYEDKRPAIVMLRRLSVCWTFWMATARSHSGQLRFGTRRKRPARNYESLMQAFADHVSLIVAHDPE